LLPHLWKSTAVSGILSLIVGVVVLAWPQKPCCSLPSRSVSIC